MDRQRLETALRNAHAAGDTAAATRLAQAIRALPAQAAPMRGSSGLSAQAQLNEGLIPSGDDYASPTAAEARADRAGQLDLTRQYAAQSGGQMASDAMGRLRSGESGGIAGAARDVGLTALGGVGAVWGGAAGLAGDVAERAGVPRAPQLARDLAAIPEAAAGTLGAPAGVARQTVRGVDIQGPRGPSVASDIARAEASGVRVMTSDVRPPTTAIGRQLQSAGESIPFTGTGGVRAQQFEQRQDAVRDVVRNFGGEETPIDTLLTNVSEDFIARRGERLTQYVTQKRDILEGLPQDVPVDVSRAVSRLEDEIAVLERQGPEANSALINTLTQFRDDLQNKSITDVEAIRARMGDAFSGAGMENIRSTGEKIVRRVYGDLREDMGDFIRANGERNDIRGWTVSNRRLAEMAGELNVSSLRNVLRTGEETPENISRLLLSSNTSDVRRVYRSLSPEGQANARAVVMAEALAKATRNGLDDISPARFASQIARRGRQVGVMFSASDQAVVNGLLRTLKLTEQADRAGLNPPTGVRAVPFLAFDAASGSLGGPMGATLAAGGVGAITRAYETPAVRSILMRLSRTQPGSDAERRYITQLNEMNLNAAPVGAATITGQQQEGLE